MEPDRVAASCINMEPDRVAASCIDMEPDRANKVTSPILHSTYAQFVVGTPGSGKSTYCTGMSEFMRKINRRCVVVNLDPANDILPYDCVVDIRDLIRLEDVMNDGTEGEDGMVLGPNGGLLFCMDYLEKNIQWLKDALAPFEKDWILFDCPGQVELYTIHPSMKNIFTIITDCWKWRAACVHLVDVAHCLDPARFISALLLSLTAIIHMELPHINVLSKIDQVRQFGELPLGLQFYTEVLDLSYLLSHLEADPHLGRLASLNRAICTLIEEFSMVRFTPLKIESKHSVFRLMQDVDRALGYPFVNDL